MGGARSAGLTAVARLLARDLAFDYPGPIRAVDGLDLAIEGAELVCLIGPNGCGKSTLLRLIAGGEPADGGKIEIGDKVVMHYFAQHVLETEGLAVTHGHSERRRSRTTEQ